MAAHVLGYAGTDNRGLAGLELSLERVLGGRDGSETFVKDPFGRVLNVVESSPERPGRDVFLTIDHTIQANVESVLAVDGVAVGRRARDGSRARCAIAAASCAMAVSPGFDANVYARTDADRIATWR